MVLVSREDDWLGEVGVCRKVEGEVWVASGQEKEVEAVVTGVQGGGEEKEEGVVWGEGKGIVGGFS